jgi:hypothetical protein
MELIAEPAPIVRKVMLEMDSNAYVRNSIGLRRRTMVIVWFVFYGHVKILVMIFEVAESILSVLIWMRVKVYFANVQVMLSVAQQSRTMKR